jgi:hypothetical protein
MHKPTAQSKMKTLLVKLGKDGEYIQRLENGKFNVYWSNQDQYDEYTSEMISTMETEANQLRLEVADLKTQADGFNKEIHALQNRPTIDALREQLASYTAQLSDLQARASAKEGAPPIDPKARDKLIKKGKEWLKLWKTRKDNVMEAIDTMSENFNKKPKKFANDLELDTTLGIKPAPYNIIKDKFKQLTGSAKPMVSNKRKR